MLFWSSNQVPAFMELPETNISLIAEVALWVLLSRGPIDHPEMSKSNFFMRGFWLQQVIRILQTQPKTMPLTHLIDLTMQKNNV